MVNAVEEGAAVVAKGIGIIGLEESDIVVNEYFEEVKEGFPFGWIGQRIWIREMVLVKLGVGVGHGVVL